MAIFSAPSSFSSRMSVDSDSDISQEVSASILCDWSDRSGFESIAGDVSLEDISTISTFCSSRSSPCSSSSKKIACSGQDSDCIGLEQEKFASSSSRSSNVISPEKISGILEFQARPGLVHSTATGRLKRRKFAKNRVTLKDLNSSRFGVAKSVRLRRAGNHLLSYSLNYGLKLLVKSQHHKSIKLFRAQSNHWKPHIVEYNGGGLANLPTELIMSILDFCDFSSQYALTATCRLLCSITFPLFLAKSGLILPNLDPGLSNLDQDTPCGAIDIKTPEEALALLVWKRQPTFHCVSFLHFVLESSVERTITLVNRSLAFFDLPMPLAGPFAKFISIYISSFRKIDAQACRLIYGLRNSGCAELSITGLTSDDNLYSYRETTGMPLGVEPTATGYERLESFKSCGSFPFLSPLLPFTIRNLIHPRLRDLYLTVNGFSAGKWAKFLQDLSLRNLVALTIGGSIPLVSVLKFLRRHRRLKRLTLSAIEVCFHPPALPKKFSILRPDLEFIDAPTLYILEILKYVRQANRLSHIAVQTDLYNRTSTIDIANSCRSSANALFQQLKLFPSVTKVELHLSRTGSLDFCDTSNDVDVPPERFLAYVNTLCFFKSGGSLLSNGDLIKILSWISLFPSLSTVELWENGDDSRHDWKSALSSMNIVPVVQKLNR